MANRRGEPVSYRPFRVEPQLAEGLLGVARPGGEVLERAAAGLFRLASVAGERADQEASFAGKRAGEQAAISGRPELSVTGGEAIGGEYVPGAGEVSGEQITRGINGSVRQVVSDAATRHGVSPEAMLRIAYLESGGNPSAKNPRSSAGGLFQFIDSTAKNYGLSNRYDPVQAADAAARLAKDNAGHLRKVLGREPTGGELYLAHQQGAGGAARLLQNRGRRAADVVGATAVKLNGGNANMTAGQFADLWIRKAGGASVPVAVDRTVTASTGSTPAAGAPARTPTSVSASGGGFRPTGRNTIYGRAFDAAGAQTYLQLVDSEIRSTTSQLFDRHRDDPEALGAAFDDLKAVLKQDHVFPEVEADFEVGFETMAGRYLDQARSNVLARQEKEDRAAFIEQTASLETDQARRLADFDPGTDAAADSLAASQQAIDDHYDSAVVRGLLDADDAAEAKINSRRSAALAFYGKQADALDAEGLKAMREEMRADFADGGIEGLDGQAWSELDGQIERVEKNKRAEGNRLENDFRERGDKQAARIAAGFDVDDAEMARLTLEANASPKGRETLRETWAKISTAKAIKDFSVSEGRKYVAGLKKQYGDKATDAELRTLGFAESMLDAKRKAIANDSVSYAEAQGIVPETPMLTDAGDAGQMEGIMSSRVKAAEMAATELEAPVRFLKAGEAKALADSIRKDPASGVAIAGSIVAGAGPYAGQVLAEFGDDAPMIAEAGAIMSIGGSARAAEDLILGYGKNLDGKPYANMKTEQAVETFGDVVGDALALYPKDAERAKRGALSIARKRIADAGVEPDSDEAKEIHTRAVQEASGALFDRGVQWGGFADFDRPGWFSGATKIIIPSAIRADAFADLLGALTDEDVGGLRVKPKPGSNPWNIISGRTQRSLADTIRDGVPVAVRGGYRFALGDPAGEDPQWIEDEKGDPFVLDLLSLRDQLEPRVPGAFR